MKCTFEFDDLHISCTDILALSLPKNSICRVQKNSRHKILPIDLPQMQYTQEETPMQAAESQTLPEMQMTY